MTADTAKSSPHNNSLNGVILTGIDRASKKPPSLCHLHEVIDWLGVVAPIY